MAASPWHWRLVVAPVAEEIFFRAFLPRAAHAPAVWLAALIDAIVFGSLHFQGLDTAIILPVIACSARDSASSMNARLALRGDCDPPGFNIRHAVVVPLPAS